MFLEGGRECRERERHTHEKGKEKKKKMGKKNENEDGNEKYKNVRRGKEEGGYCITHVYVHVDVCMK